MTKSILLILIEIIVLIVITFIKNTDSYITSFLRRNFEIRTILAFFIFLIIMDLIRRSLNYLYAKKHELPLQNKDNFQFGINNITRFIVGIGIIVTLFQFFGIDLKMLLTSLSIVAAAIAIITKEYINDFFIGLYFSFSKDIEINDYVKIGDHKGKVIEIRMFKVKILNDDDDLVILPNSKAYNNEIINFTKRDIRSLSVDFQIDIKTIKNIEEFEEELIKSLFNFYEFLEMDSFNLKIVDMKKDAIGFKFQYTLKRLNRDLQRKIRRKTVRQIFNYISEKNKVLD